MSFVEVGGDSVSAVMLVYLLRQYGLIEKRSDITAATILRASTLQELGDLIAGKRLSNWSKEDVVDSTSAVDFRPRLKPRRYSSNHLAIQFRGCVDASPVLSLD
jgi:hypothetical protein